MNDLCSLSRLHVLVQDNLLQSYPEAQLLGVQLELDVVSSARQVLLCYEPFVAVSELRAQDPAAACQLLVEIMGAYGVARVNCTLVRCYSF